MSLNETKQTPEYVAPEPVEPVESPVRGRRRGTAAVIGSAVAVLALGGLGYGLLADRTPPPDGGPPPWDAPSDPKPLVLAAGLKFGPMGMAEHYHSHLDVYVDGKPVSVAADIGIDPGSEEMAAVHTHDTRGVIHIETDVKGQTYTLGQIFTEWGVTLNATQIGTLKAGNGKTLTTYVNGQKLDGDPAAIVLKPHLQIALVYGKPGSSFTPPATYRFKPDE
ncbi:hypothetical protein AB0O34_33625 [Sphaerisporangium sp. NPDC088356]|uniref:hypothetical protein n=1 Tax=Sphaerisporangium sp. NPDC088356 TaxID=3154871 RepID=UPI00343307DD